MPSPNLYSTLRSQLIQRCHQEKLLDPIRPTTQKIRDGGVGIFAFDSLCPLLLAVKISGCCLVRNKHLSDIWLNTDECKKTVNRIPGVSYTDVLEMICYHEVGHLFTDSEPGAWIIGIHLWATQSSIPFQHAKQIVDLSLSSHNFLVP